MEKHRWPWAVACVWLTFLFAAPAEASHLLRDSQGRWRHLHTTQFVIDTRGVQDTGYRYWLPRAAAEWSNGTGIVVTARDGPGNIVARAGRYGTRPIGWATIGYHSSTATVTFNLDRVSGGLFGPALDLTRRRVACHEVGHALGLGHGGDGCMADNRSEGQDELRLILCPGCPGPHDRAQLAQAYSGRH